MDLLKKKGKREAAKANNTKKVMKAANTMHNMMRSGDGASQ